MCFDYIKITIKTPKNLRVLRIILLLKVIMPEFEANKIVE